MTLAGVHTLGGVRRGGFSVVGRVEREACGRGFPLALDVNFSCRGAFRRAGFGRITGVTRSGVSLTLTENNSRIIIETRSRSTHFCNNGAGPVRGQAHVHTEVVDRTLRRLVIRTSGIVVVKRDCPSVSIVNSYLKVHQVSRVGDQRT